MDRAAFFPHPGFNSSVCETVLASVRRTLEFQTEALTNLSAIYGTDDFAQRNLEKSLKILYEINQIKGGKVVVSGVGKLYKIASKMVATFNSLSIHAQGLHPTEALHGDLGLVRENRDCILFVTASGNTPELIQLLPHLDRQIPIILLTSNRYLKLAMHPQITSLMYAPLCSKLNEEAIHGLPAPTVLATLALVLADAAILALSEIVVTDLPERRRRFSMKHPGGSIGADLSHLNSNLHTTSQAQLLRDIRGLVSSSLAVSYLSLGQLRNLVETGEEKQSMSNLSSSSEQMIWENDTDDEVQAELNAEMIDHELSAAVKLAPQSQIFLTLYSKILDTLESKNELQFLRWLARYDYIVYQIKCQRFAVATNPIRHQYSRYCTGNSWPELQLRTLALFKMIS